MPSTLEGMQDEQAWIPTMAGNTIAYVPECRYGMFEDGKMLWTKWKPIQTVDGKGLAGIPYPAHCGGLFKSLGLYGYEQAWALAWECAAHAAADLHKVQVRLSVYEFKYDLKARKCEGKEVTCEDRS